MLGFFSPEFPNIMKRFNKGWLTDEAVASIIWQRRWKKKKNNPGENLSGASLRPRDGKLKWKCDETISMVLIKFRPSCIQVVNTVPRTEKNKKCGGVKRVCVCVDVCLEGGVEQAICHRPL